GGPSIVQMSTSGPANDAADNAVTAVCCQCCCVSAGNNNVDAECRSLARNRFILDFGASTIGGTQASFSNFAVYVDIYALEQYIISSWITPVLRPQQTGYRTSMATPHVSGIPAYII
ncbi:hypothetical protein DL96DRAFT_1436975, partial [Flagelloscypha sp. PMI_526]